MDCNKSNKWTLLQQKKNYKTLKSYPDYNHDVIIGKRSDEK